MGADTIEVSQTELHIARHGIHMQLKCTTKLVEQFGSLAQAIETLGMGDFLENQAQVIAADRTWVQHANRTMRAMEKKCGS